MDKKHTIHMVGNTHFDPVWLWTWDEGMSSIRSTFLAALDRMDEEPEFIYSFSCPAVFEWIRAVDPSMFCKIQQRVKEGRWELVEGWWLQPDCNFGSGESYARQGLYGQRYLMEHFGLTARSAFNIDSFGHAVTLPQILRKSGIEYYTFSRPDKKEQTLPGPLFRWEGLDGSIVLTYREPGSYCGEVEGHIRTAIAQIDNLSHDLMLVYGVTNHGGAPTKRAIAKIKEMGTADDMPCAVKFNTNEGFFGTQDINALPVVCEELVTKWFGVFSNFPEIKQNNRRCEYALLNAEKAAVATMLVNGASYPGEKLSACWKDVMFNQFHDILGGACIKQAYADARNLHGRALQTANEIMHFSIQSVTKDVHLPAMGADWNVVAWNLNAFTVEAQIEAEVQWAWEFEWYRGPVAIADDQGGEYPCQLIRECSVIPGFRSRFVFTATLPSLGYKAFRVLRRCPAIAEPTGFTADAFHMESRQYIVEICSETGCIATVFDKHNRRTVLKDGAKPTVRQDDGDTWAFNVSGFGDVLGTFHLEESKLIEDGPVMATIRTKASFGNSYLEQDFTLYKQTDALECHYRVFWREKNTVLKLSFDTTIQKPVVTAAAPYGSVERKSDGVEMPMGEWLDLSSPGQGLSILTGSLFAYDVTCSVASLTVLRSAIFGDLRMPDGLNPAAEYEYLGQGVTEGRWALLFHDGDWRQAKTPQLTMQFCNPPVAVIEANHPGNLSQERSFASIDGRSTILTVLKQAENGDGLIARAYEYAGGEDGISINVAAQKLETVIKRYEIKTIRMNKTDLLETDILETTK